MIGAFYVGRMLKGLTDGESDLNISNQAWPVAGDRRYRRPGISRLREQHAVK
jgi:hypothetical protein